MTEPTQPPQAPWGQPPAPAPVQPTVPYPTMPPPPPGPPQQYTPYGYAAPPYARSQTNGLAIASMVVGIVGVLMFWLYALLPILAVVFGHVALSQIRRHGQAGRGMAIAGLATGYSGIAFFALVIVAAFASS